MLAPPKNRALSNDDLPAFHPADETDLQGPALVLQAFQCGLDVRDGIDARFMTQGIDITTEEIMVFANDFFGALDTL